MKQNKRRRKKIVVHADRIHNQCSHWSVDSLSLLLFLTIAPHSYCCLNFILVFLFSLLLLLLLISIHLRFSWMGLLSNANDCVRAILLHKTNCILQENERSWVKSKKCCFRLIHDGISPFIQNHLLSRSFARPLANPKLLVCVCVCD